MTTDRPPSRRTRRPLRVLLLTLFGCASVFIYWAFFATYHLATVQDGVLYRDGNRTIRTFVTAIRKTKPKTVVCLVDDAEVADPRKPQFARELNELPQHNVNVVRIPITLGGWPTSDDIQKFLTTAADKSNQPVLLHCAQGVRRTGMLVAAYQMSVMGYDKDKARSAVLSFGHKGQTLADINQFIDLYDPATRTLTTRPAATGAE